MDLSVYKLTSNEKRNGLELTVWFSLPGRKVVSHTGAPGEAETCLCQCGQQLYVCDLVHKADFIR